MYGKLQLTNDFPANFNRPNIYTWLLGESIATDLHMVTVGILCYKCTYGDIYNGGMTVAFENTVFRYKR